MIALAVTLLMISPLRGFLGERSQLADLRVHAAQLDKQNATLQARIAQLSDSTYLELLARECLGMVKYGETAFVIVPTHGKPKTPDC
jgi:cell division protein FtsB